MLTSFSNKDSGRCDAARQRTIIKAQRLFPISRRAQRALNEDAEPLNPSFWRANGDSAAWRLSNGSDRVGPRSATNPNRTRQTLAGASLTALMKTHFAAHQRFAPREKASQACENEKTPSGKLRNGIVARRICLIAGTEGSRATKSSHAN